MFHGKAGLLLSFIVNIDSSYIEVSLQPTAKFQMQHPQFFSTFLCDFVPIIPFLCLSLAIRGGGERKKTRIGVKNKTGPPKASIMRRRGRKMGLREREREIQLEKRGMGGGQRKLRKGYK